MKIGFEEFIGFGFVGTAKVDLFIHVSYEDRCTSFFSKDGANTLDVSRVFLFHSVDSMENPGYARNYAKIKNKCLEFWGLDVIDIPSERDFPLKAISLLDSKFETATDRWDRVMIDISTFTRDRLACLVHYFWRIRLKVPSVWFIYTAPKAFDTENDAGWLTKGVRRIAPVAGFNCRQAVNKKPLLVMVLGHESERALITLRNREPDAVVVIQQGGTQISEGAGIAARRHASSIKESMSAPIIGSYESDYNDASGVRLALGAIFDKYGDEYNLAVLIGGSKIQVIGLILACIDNPKIEMVYSFPQKYNMEKFSSGSGRSESGLLKF